MSASDTGKSLVKFFNLHGFNDDLNRSFGIGGSKHDYVMEKFAEVNGTERLLFILQDYYHPANFINAPDVYNQFLEDLNKYLKFDKLQARNLGGDIQFIQASGNVIVPEKLEGIGHAYIAEQIQKCNSKIATNDYSGAITNARSLVEHVLEHLHLELIAEELEEVELPKKYKKVAKLLNLNPENHSSDEIKQMLSGFFSVIGGFSCFRNDWSDSHARKYNPEKHHAVLAVNSALTICEFLFSSYSYQKQKEKEQVA